MSALRLPDYLEHIAAAAARAINYVEGLDFARFEQDTRTQEAVIRAITIIGEAASRIMDGHASFVDARSNVSWQAMRGIRNRMVHGYFDINLQIVWDTVQQDLPVLRQQIELLILEQQRQQK